MLTLEISRISSRFGVKAFLVSLNSRPVVSVGTHGFHSKAEANGVAQQKHRQVQGIWFAKDCQVLPVTAEIAD
jgi:hypothetical protein